MSHFEELRCSNACNEGALQVAWRHLRLCPERVEQLVGLQLRVEAQAVVDVDRSLYVLAGVETQVVLLVIAAG